MATNEINSPKLFVFDCDSTIIQNEVIELIAEEAGSLNKVAKITERAMRGELDFKESLEERVQTFDGLSVDVLETVIQKVRFTPGVKQLVEKIHAEGGFVAIVSGGFHEVVDSIAAELNADFWLANRLEVEAGAFTGKTDGKIVDAEVKAQMLEKWATEQGVDMADTVAIGDGANDIPMMRKAGLSIAFNAKPIVQEAADISISDDLSKAIPYVYQ